MGLPCHGNEKSFSGSRGGREKTVSFRNARGSFFSMIINENDAYNCTMTGGWRRARVEGGD